MAVVLSLQQVWHEVLSNRKLDGKIEGYDLLCPSEMISTNV